jgi:hypothetical protein
MRNQSLEFMRANFGKAGSYYYWISRGVDNREVRADRIRKSVGAENTFSSDLTEFDAMVSELQPLIEKVWRHCEDKGTRGRTVTLKVKFADFEVISRSQSLSEPVGRPFRTRTCCNRTARTTDTGAKSDPVARRIAVGAADRARVGRASNVAETIAAPRCVRDRRLAGSGGGRNGRRAVLFLISRPTQSRLQLMLLFPPTIVLGFRSFFKHGPLGLDGGRPAVMLPFGFFERRLRLGDCLLSPLALQLPCGLFLSALVFTEPSLLLERQRGLAGRLVVDFDPWVLLRLRADLRPLMVGCVTG